MVAWRGDATGTRAVHRKEGPAASGRSSGMAGNGVRVAI